MLELNLQHGEDTKVDYNPIDKLVGIYNDLVVNKLLTVREYAESVNKSDKEIERERDIALLMVDFLRYIKGDNKFYLARNLDIAGPLLELYSMTNRVKDNQLSLLKDAVFANLLFEPVGDMTRYIRKIKKLIGTPYLEEYLSDHQDVEPHIDAILPEYSELLTYEYINRKIRIRTDIASVLQANLNKALNKYAKEDARTRLVKLANDSLSKLQEMDLNMIAKMSNSQKDDLAKSLKLIKGLCDDINDNYLAK